MRHLKKHLSFNLFKKWIPELALLHWSNLALPEALLHFWLLFVCSWPVFFLQEGFRIFSCPLFWNLSTACLAVSLSSFTAPGTWQHLTRILPLKEILLWYFYPSFPSLHFLCTSFAHWSLSLQIFSSFSLLSFFFSLSGWFSHLQIFLLNLICFYLESQF